VNWFDLAALGFLVMCAGTGAWKGLSKSGFGLLAAGIAFAGAVWLWPDSMWGFWITFALIVTASAVAAKLLGKWCKLTGSSWVDHLLGGGFGVANGVLCCVLSVLALLAFAPKPVRQQVMSSTTAPYAVGAALTIAEMAPESLKSRVEEGYLEVESHLPPPFRRVLKRLPPQVI